jgi:hypothetical protein
MLTDVQIINLGMSKISTSRINRIDPAQTPLEAYMASNYPHWRRVELTKRRWVFALEENYPLTLTNTLTDVEKPYVYQMPNLCLRPVRTKYTEWKQRGTKIYSAYPTLKLDFIKNVSEADFDPLFDDVLACWVAYQSAEYVTQSNPKKEAAKAMYDNAVTAAAQANAFVMGPEDVSADDSAYAWLQDRYM